MTTITEEIESEPATSRPLPAIEVRKPAAVRGIPEIRKHLDGPRCVFCDVPVAEDEQQIRTDWGGTMVRRHICKGHSEHPESFVGISETNPEDLRYCPRCDRITNLPEGRDLCLGCLALLNEGKVPEHYRFEARDQILAAGGRDD